VQLSLKGQSFSKLVVEIPWLRDSYRCLWKYIELVLQYWIWAKICYIQPEVLTCYGTFWGGYFGMIRS
jgi:hypothetical protein